MLAVSIVTCEPTAVPIIHKHKQFTMLMKLLKLATVFVQSQKKNGAAFLVGTRHKEAVYNRLPLLLTPSSIWLLPSGVDVSLAADITYGGPDGKDGPAACSHNRSSRGTVNSRPICCKVGGGHGAHRPFLKGRRQSNSHGLLAPWSKC